MEISISGFIQAHMKEQTLKLNTERASWDKKKAEKDQTSSNKRNDYKDKISKKENQKDEYAKQYFIHFNMKEMRNIKTTSTFIANIPKSQSVKVMKRKSWKIILILMRIQAYKIKFNI